MSEIPFGRSITSDESSWIGSIVSLGAVCGPFIFGYGASRFGRKWTICSIGVPFAVSYFILAFAKSVELYYFARFLVGVGVGGVFTVLPMYMGEIATDSNRGALGSLMNVLLCFGLVFSYSLGPFVSIVAFNIVLAVFPCIFMVAVVFFAPESHHYHMSKGNHVEAEKVHKKFRGDDHRYKTELEDIKVGLEKTENGSILDLFTDKKLIKAFIISLALVGFQQFSGINAVLFYAQTIFSASGSDLKAEYASIIIGGVQFVTSFITPLFVDRLGRKILLYFSAIGMLLSETLLGVYFYLKDDNQDVGSISWLPIVSLVLYILTYNCGFGPLPWAVMGELFPANVKSTASAFTAAFCWFISFLITKFFSSMVDGMGMGPSFWVFAAFCLVAFIFTLFYVIETKGKSLQEIQEILEK